MAIIYSGASLKHSARLTITFAIKHIKVRLHDQIITNNNKQSTPLILSDIVH